MLSILVDCPLAIGPNEMFGWAAAGYLTWVKASKRGANIVLLRVERGRRRVCVPPEICSFLGRWHTVLKIAMVAERGQLRARPDAVRTPHLVALCEALAGAGHEVTVVVRRDDGL